jgi:hypothetical protein
MSYRTINDRKYTHDRERVTKYFLRPEVSNLLKWADMFQVKQIFPQAF